MFIVNFHVNDLGDLIFRFTIYHNWWWRGFKPIEKGVKHNRFEYRHVEY